MKERLDGVVAWVRDRWPPPKPTKGQVAKSVPLIGVLVVFLVLIGRNYDTVDFPHYSVPEGFVPRPPPTTRPPGEALPVLAVVPGTTVRDVPPNVGTSTLTGVVIGPQGAVPGAVVRVERSIMGTTQVTDVLTDAAGGWTAAGIGGGRYRVRAFLPPFLAPRTAEVFLLRADDSRTVDLAVEEFDEPSAVMAAAPVPVSVGQPVNVAVRVTGRFVDGDGFVGVQPLPGASVDYVATTGWVRDAPTGTVVTNASGTAVATFTCRQAGSVTVTATVRISADVAPTVLQGSFDCTDPSSVTTTTQPGTGITVLPATTTTAVAVTTSTTQP